ncbi:MAG: DUF3108 domain-containing protein [Bacteroidales bacterium]|nr:DUF3108 domain-containing protein [Bacteroidales bacterium]
MKRTLFALATLLFSASPCLAQKLPAEALGTATFEIRYTWGAIDAKVATATVSINPDTYQGQDAYHSHAFVKTSAIFRLFIGADITVDGYISRSERQPLYAINPFRKGGKDCKFEYIYDKDAKRITNVWQSPKETVETTYAYDGKTFELLSLLAFARFHEASDKPETIRVLLGNNASSAVLTYQGLDTETFPGVTAERFLLRLTGRGVMENGSGNELVFWRSHDSSRKVLGLEAPVNPGHMSIRVKK